ncbi:MAG: DUF445 family protein [Peptococcaceae bacterium]|nr:DUF445 family protein [Peptococcaceae bacterium]
MWISLVMLPVVGALIGWGTNWLAVKLLFRPCTPVKIPGLPVTIQGVIPKRRYELARSVGEVVARDILSIDDLLGYIRSDDFADRMARSAGAAIYDAIINRTSSLIPQSLKKFIAEMLLEMTADQMPLMIKHFLNEISEDAKEEIDIAQMIEDKLNTFPLEELERVVFRVAAKEIKHITVLGGILGFIIGLCQVGILFLVR